MSVSVAGRVAIVTGGRHEDVNIAPKHIGASRYRSEQQREADVVLSAQRCPQS